MIDNNLDDFFEKRKCVRHDKQFLPHSKCNIAKSSDELITQNKENLASNDINKICDSINFFAQNVGSIDLQIIKEIFNLYYNSSFNEYDCLEIYDCINQLVEEISKLSIFLENTDLAMIIVKFLIDFSGCEEKQFAITAYQSISYFIFANKSIASFLSDEFLNECLNGFFAFIDEFKKLGNNDCDDIDNLLYIIQNILRIFLAMFFHQDLISSEYSDMVVKCYHSLFDIKIPSNHQLDLKTFIIDNAYWFAISAPDESIKNLLSPQFIDNLIYLLEIKDPQSLENDQGQDVQIDFKYLNAVKTSLFETIGKITEHDDQFSLFFLQPPINLLNRLDNYCKWDNETKYSFLKILSNFTACSDLTPSLSMIESSEITEFLKSVLKDCSFNAKKEAFVVLFNMIYSKNSNIIEYVLSNFSESFQDLIEFLKVSNQYFNICCLNSIYIAYNYLETQSDEMKKEFIGLFASCEWVSILENLSVSSDAILSKLANILIDIIENLN